MGYSLIPIKISEKSGETNYLKICNLVKIFNKLFPGSPLGKNNISMAIAHRSLKNLLAIIALMV